VVEQAKHLVMLQDFKDCAQDTARIQLLYERIYQRSPRPEEVKLGLDFVAEHPATEKLSAQDSEVRPVINEERPFRPGQGKFRRGAGPQRKREPLSAWEEYAHALLQANETSFVN